MENQINIEFTWTADRSVALEAKMTEKLELALSKFKFDYINVKLQIQKEGTSAFGIRAVLDLPKYKTIVVNGVDKDILNAFDKIKHMLCDEVKKAKNVKRDN